MMNHRLNVWLCLPLSVMMTAGDWWAAAAWGQTYHQPDYYTLKSHGRPIGQISIERYPLSLTGQSLTEAGASNDAAGATVTEIRNTNHATREGTPFGLNEVSRFVETRQSGQPLGFSYAYSLGEQNLMAASGQLQGNALDISLQRENTLSESKTPITTERFLFPAGEGIHQIYRQHFHDPKGSRFGFQTLSLGLQPQLVNSEVIPGKTKSLRLGHGKRQTVRQFEIRNPANPTTGFQEWRDDQGKLYQAKSSGGDELEMVLAAVDDRNWDQNWNQGRNNNRSWNASSNESRLDTLDVVTASAVVSNKIAQPHITTEALYRLSPIHNETIDWSSAIPVSERQSIQKLTDNQLYLNVKQKAPQDASVVLPVDGPPEFLQSTPYLQSNDPEIDRVALEIVGKEKRAYFAARMLQQWVYENIARKDLALGFASAKETLLNREGDCTEHAVLLSALTRAVGIPSRVAVGLIYLPEGDSQVGRFVYHMWTEIYLGNRQQGEWVPMDATRPEPLMDATHIKLADSALNNAGELISLTQRVTGVMGRLKIDTLKAMSTAQSVLNMDAAPEITATALHKVDLQAIDIQTLSRQAIQHFRVELPPPALSKESPDGLFTYGVEALSKGRYTEAQSYFNQSLSKLRQPIALYRMGERLAGIEMYGLAQVAFQRAVEKDPRLSGLARDWTARFIPAQTLPDDLNAEFMEAISAPGEASNALRLKTIVVQARYFAPAYRHLGEESTGSEAINALQDAVRIAPDDFRNHESLGDALMQDGKYQAARQAYQNAENALKLSPAFLQSKPEWLTDLDGKQALAHGSQILAQNKYSVGGWLTLGRGLVLQKRREEATQAFDNALALNPGSGEAKIRIFGQALQNADWKTMNAHKNSIATLAGGNAQAAGLLGLYQMHSRQYGAAVNTLHHAITIAPGQGEAYRTLAQTYLRMADLADDKAGASAAAQSKRLITQAQTILRRGSKNANTAVERHSLSLQLARLLIKSNKADEALQLANGVLADNPINGAAWAAKGKAQFYLGQYTEAKATLSTALQLNPNDADMLVQLGHVAKEEGRDGLALDYYQKAYKADPFSQEASDSLRGMLQQLHIAGHQPPNYLFLSEDEHDYLVQMLYQSRALTRQTVTYLRTLDSLPGRAGRIEYSAKGIAASQQLYYTLENLNREGLQLERTLQTQPVPARLASLNEDLHNALLVQLGAVKAGMLVSYVLDFSSPKVLPQTYAQLLYHINAPAKSIQQILVKLNSHLPTPVMHGLIAEAQLEDLPDMQREIMSTTNALVSRKEKDTPAAKAGSLPIRGGQPAAMTRNNQTTAMQAPQIKGNNTGTLAPNVSPENIKNISLPAGMTPDQLKSFTRPATGH